MNIVPLINTMLLLFGMLAIGFLAGKIRLMTEEMNRQLSSFLVSVTSPLQILGSVLSGSFPMSNREVLLLTLLTLPLYAVLIGLSFLIPKIFRVKPSSSAVLRFLFIFSNIGYLGYPLVESMYGVAETFYVTVFVLAFQFVCWTYGVCLLASGAEDAADAEKPDSAAGTSAKSGGLISWRLFLSPCIIAAVAAYILYFLRVPCPALLYKIIYQAGAVTSPLAMIILGCSLAYMKAGEVFGRWQIYILAAVRMLVLPVLFFLVLRTFIRNETMLRITTLILCMPSGTNATLMSYRYGADAKLGSAGVFITTLLSAGSIPLMMSILFR